MRTQFSLGNLKNVGVGGGKCAREGRPEIEKKQDGKGGGVDLFYLAQDVEQCRTFVNTVMNIRFCMKCW
jgi:hypothetical protein